MKAGLPLARRPGTAFHDKKNVAKAGAAPSARVDSPDHLVVSSRHRSPIRRVATLVSTCQDRFAASTCTKGIGAYGAY